MKSHRTDGVSLIFAILFFGVVVAWLTTDVAELNLPTAGWIVAVGLIFFGILGLFGTRRNGRTPEDSRQQEPTDWPGLS